MEEVVGNFGWPCKASHFFYGSFSDLDNVSMVVII
uniref:Uncharacterized protein n=1 Tax=Arundo donax TaxID=35708 RepID=A0A0A8ZD54_ARUDO